jgi:hypothetical protein
MELSEVRYAISQLETADTHLCAAETQVESRTAILRLRVKLSRLLDGMRNKAAWMERAAESKAQHAN